MTTSSWDTVKRFVSFSHQDIASLPHSHLLAFVVAGFVLAVTRAATVFRAVHSVESSKSSVTNWFFDIVQDKLTVRNVPEDYLVTIAWGFFSIQCAKIAAVAFLVYLNYKRRQDSDTAKSLVHGLAFFFWLDTQVIPVIICDLCIHLCNQLQGVYIFVGVVILICLPVELALNNLLTFDFSYFRRNLVQGRNYSHATVTTIFTLITSLFFFISRQSPTYTESLLNNLIHSFFSLALIGLRLRWDLHFYAVKANRISIAFEAFYVWISISNFLGIAVADFVKVVDFDYLWLICLPLSCWLIINLLGWRSKVLLERKTTRKDDISLGDSLYYLEKLYHAYLNQQESEQKVFLYARMVEHTKTCVDPCCLCHLARIPYDISIGQSASVHARDIYKKLSQGKHGNKENTLTFFNDQEAIEALKQKHGVIIAARISTDTKKLQVFNEGVIEESNIGYLMNLEANEDFPKVMAGFLRALIGKRIHAKQFKAVVSNLAFLYSEYHNPIAVLLLAYDYIFSPSYASEANLVTHAILQNYITVAKAQLKGTDSSSVNSSMALESVSLAEVLDFRTRTHDLRFVVQDSIVKKIDLYSKLAQKVIDFSEITKLGEEVYIKTVKTQKEIDSLLDLSLRNSRLARMGVIFEMCVLERPIVSSRLRKSYKESYNDTKNRVGSINSYNTKFKFSPFNSSNIVVFIRNYDNAFRICKHTQNAVHLFGMSTDELNGQKISDFMPKMVAKCHDKFVFSYLNGQSQNRHQGKFYVPVMTKSGHMRSTMMLIRPELQFFNEIYMASLISIRKKNHFPILFTDLNGGIVGANKQAMKVISNNTKVQESTLFVIFPRLFQIYFPSIKGQHDNSFTRNNTGRDQNSPDIMDSPAQEDTIEDEEDYNKEQDGALRSTQGLDLFLFQMLYKTFTTGGEAENYSRTIDSSMQDQLNESKISKSTLKKYVQPRNISMNLQYEILTKFITQHRRQILDNLPKIFKAKVDIETNHFQGHISLREITLDSVHKTRNRVQHFFKAFAANNTPYLMEVLMVSPESLNNLYKLCSYRLKLKELKEQAGIHEEDNETKPKHSTQIIGVKAKVLAIAKLRQSDDRVQTDGNPSPTGLFPIESMPEDELQSTEINFRELQRLENQGPLKEDTPIPVLRLTSEPLKDYYNVSIKPVQQEVSIFSHVVSASDNFEEVKIEITKPTKDQDAVISLLREKIQIQKFTQMVLSIKTELERDYESGKIQKLAEIIIASLSMYGNARTPIMALQALFSRAGSVNSSRESLPGQSDFIEGKALKVEDSVSSDQDSLEEIQYEYSDPLKTNLENDQPSTFLKSSSKMSVKTTQDAILIRNSIRRSQWRLMFRKWEYGMFALAIILVILKVVFKFVYDIAINDIYKYEISVNLIANILRPTGFIYKESLKGWIQQFEDFDLQNLPDKKIFYSSQLQHYQIRLVGQAGDLMAFFSSGLDIPYSFMPKVKAESISIFSMTLSLLNTYIRVSTFLQTQPDQDDAAFIRLSLPDWNQARTISREIFQVLYRYFLEQDASRSSKLQQVYLYFGLNYAMNALIIVLMVLGTLKVAALMHFQLRQAADFLLRIDKVFFRLAIKKFSRMTSGQEEGSRERQELRQAVLVHIKHADILDSEKSLVMKKDEAKSKAHLQKSDQEAVRKHTYLVGFPNKDAKTLGVLTMLIFLFLSLPSIINMILVLSDYSILEASLKTSSAVNLCSSSLYYLAAIQYRIYISNAIPGTPVIDPELLELHGSLAIHVDNAKTIADPYLQDVLSSTLVCDKVGVLVDARQKELCLLSSESGSDSSVLQFIHDISLQIRLLDVEIKFGNPEYLKSFFESKYFIYYDLRTFFLTSVLKEISNDYMDKILENISEGSSLTNILLILYIVLMIASIIAYHFCWVPWRLCFWWRYQATLLALNDDIINSIYIKSYFGSESVVK